MPPRTKENMPMALPPGRPPDEPQVSRTSTRPSPRTVGYRHSRKVPPNDRVWSEKDNRQLSLDGKTTETKTTKMRKQRAPFGNIQTPRRNDTLENEKNCMRTSQKHTIRPLRLGCNSSYVPTTWKKGTREHANDMRPNNRPTTGKEREINSRTDNIRTKLSSRTRSKQDSKKNKYERRKSERKKRDKMENSIEDQERYECKHSDQENDRNKNILDLEWRLKTNLSMKATGNRL